MKKVASLALLVSILSLTFNSCGPRSSPTITITPNQKDESSVVARTATSTLTSTSEPIPVYTATITPAPKGETIIVNSAADNGPGTLRQAIQDAQRGDIITFDPTVFPPDNPTTIFLNNNLPVLGHANITLDASYAGVILDGSNIEGSAIGLIISDSEVKIQGLQIVNFSEIGIGLEESAKGATIGGDRNIGNGPLGQGNLISSNGLRGIDSIGASFITITGNYIGTDISGQGPLGNAGDGIWMDGGVGNVIGPNNIIAYNGTSGITIRNPETIKNTITQNSIHDNGVDGVTGIFLSIGGNTDLLPPVILDFDLEQGTARGITCPNCIVELFSDETRQGRIFEGQVTASDTGIFVLDVDHSFSGPHLTAITTDLEGNSSAFSKRTVGISGSVIFQEGNDSPIVQFHPKLATELEDNRIGQLSSIHESIFSEDDAWMGSHVQNSLGLKWHRLSIDMMDWVEVADTGFYSQFEINPLQDRYIREASENGFTINYDIVYWDDSIQTNENYTRFQTQEEIDRYLDYVQFIVEHFKGTVKYYSLLNEPNIGRGTQQFVESSDYINMVRQAVPIIRQADPEAKIIIGEVTSLHEPSAWAYLQDILTSDVISMVDGIAWHAGPATPEYREEFYYAYLSRVEEITRLAQEYGFGGEFIVGEVHFRSAVTPHPHEYSEYDFNSAVIYTMRAVVRILGRNDFITGYALEDDTYSPMMTGSIQNLSTIMAGSSPAELTVEIDSETPPIVNYNFELSNGDTLLALWTDGIANEGDPGVKSTVVIDGLSPSKVVTIDVLNGIEQELFFEVEDGNLVVRNLMIRDYPIFLEIH